MQQRPINPWTWQDAFGFSQAIEVSGQDRLLICSGQTSVDENGAPVHEGDMSAQVGKALDNLEEVLKQAGMTLANAVRINIYTTDVNALLSAVGVWQGRLSQAGCKPASTLLGVASLAFPALMVELEAIAVA
ncbi:MAG: RidA family protein [Chloroflexi bacterium]|nr:MAG: RidA family protein [Chloroflexota bacterium]